MSISEKLKCWRTIPEKLIFLYAENSSKMLYMTFL